MPETLMFIASMIISKVSAFWGTWLAQSVEHKLLISGSWSSSPVLGVELTLKK